MITIDILEAKNSLSKLVKALQSGDESEIVITRNGRPAARLLPLQPIEKRPRIGIAKGCFEVPDNIDRDNEDIAKLFYGDVAD